MSDVGCLSLFFFFFKQKTAYEMRISDWSSDVCSSDLQREDQQHARGLAPARLGIAVEPILAVLIHKRSPQRMNSCSVNIASSAMSVDSRGVASISCTDPPIPMRSAPRSEERRVGKECGSACRSGGSPDT